MRFTLAQLRKLPMPYEYDEVLDLSKDLIGFEDILDTSDVHVHATINNSGVDTYVFSMVIDVELVLECAVTLNRVPYSIHAAAEEMYSTEDINEDIYLIDGQTLDTRDAIIDNVLINKPMKVVCQGASFESDNSDSDKEEYVNPAFASLKDLL